MEPIYESASVYESVRAPLVTFPGFQAPILVSGSHSVTNRPDRPDESHMPPLLLINHPKRLKKCFLCKRLSRLSGSHLVTNRPDRQPDESHMPTPKRLPSLLINHPKCLKKCFAIFFAKEFSDIS